MVFDWPNKGGGDVCMWSVDFDWKVHPFHRGVAHDLFLTTKSGDRGLREVWGADNCMKSL